MEWHKESYDALTQLRNERCIKDDSPSAQLLPVLAFYMDHSILVLNAQALRDLAAAEDNTSSSSSEALLDIERKSIEVASRVLDLLSLDKTIIELALGFQNNQYLMICHVMTEVLRVGFHILKNSFTSLTFENRLSKEALSRPKKTLLPQGKSSV